MPDLMATLATDRAIKARLLAEWPELLDDETALRDTLDALSDFNESVLAVMRTVIEREARAKALGEIIKQMTERKRRLEDGADRLQRVCLHVMQEAPRSKIEGPDFNLYVRQGRVGYTVTDIDKLPERFVKVERSARLKDIADAVKGGEPIPDGVAPRNAQPFLEVRRS